MMIDLPARGYRGRIYLGSFLRYRPLWLNYDGSEKLIDFQVKCTLTNKDIAFEKLRADKQDLLFIAYDGQPIPYWIENFNNTEIIVWLKFSEIIPGNEAFWLYYGNGNFPGISNASATFIRIIDGLAASWHFDEESGNIAYDSSGNDNDGTIYGATWVDGKYGKALNFDGSNDYITIPHDTSFDVDKVTITAWFKADVLGGKWRKIVCHPYYDDQWSSPYAVYALGIDTNDRVFGEISIGATHTKVFGPVLNTDLWYFAAMTFDGELLKIYLNSVEEDSLSVSGSLNHRSTKVHIAKAYDAANTELFDGIIDEVCIFNRALTQEEISDLYNNYGYSTENYPGKVLVRKYTEPEPSIFIGAEGTA